MGLSILLDLISDDPRYITEPTSSNDMCYLDDDVILLLLSVK